MYPPPLLNKKRPCIVSGRAREPSLSLSHIYRKVKYRASAVCLLVGQGSSILCIAVFFIFLASKVRVSDRRFAEQHRF